MAHSITEHSQRLPEEREQGAESNVDKSGHGRGRVWWYVNFQLCCSTTPAFDIWIL